MAKERGPRILAVSVSGIGNTILFVPFLAALRRHFPQAQIELLAGGAGMAQAVEGGGAVDCVRLTPARAAGIPGFLRELRAARYDAVVTAFPSNKWQFNALARWTGARERVTHGYACARARTLAFLQNRRVPAVEGLHDVEQNLRLLTAFGLDPAGESRALSFPVGGADRDFAAGFLRERGMEGALLVGLHPGAGGKYKDWQGLIKRWPADRFARLADLLVERFDVRVLLVGGPEEAPLKQEVVQRARRPERLTVVDASLKRTAALLGRCRLMVSNDSGLMHVAAAMGVPTLGLFGPTNETRTAPWGAGCRALRADVPCCARLQYPFRTTSSKIRCTENGRCLTGLAVERVLDAAAERLAAAP